MDQTSKFIVMISSIFSLLCLFSIIIVHCLIQRRIRIDKTKRLRITPIIESSEFITCREEKEQEQRI